MPEKINSADPAKSKIDTEDGILPTSTKWRNLIAFWVLGLTNNLGYVVMLSAAYDILYANQTHSSESHNGTHSNGTHSDSVRKCNDYSTGVILLADILPSLFIKLTVPFLPFHLHLQLASTVIASTLGFFLVSQSIANHTMWLTVLGVVLTATSSGLGEVTLLKYSHRFSKTVISTWSSGTGGAGIIGAGAYVLLTKFINNLEYTMLVMLIVPVLQAIAFWLILVHPVRQIYTNDKLNASSQQQIIEVPKKTIMDKIRMVPSLLKYMAPLCLVYLFEYFINQGLYELIEFKNIFLKQNEQYRYFGLIYQIGVFISRSSVNLVTINRIWIMAVLQLFNVLLMLCDTLFYYIPSIWIVFGIIFWEGLLGGGAYVNTYYRMSKELPYNDQKTALGIVSMADAIGIALAGAIALPVQKAICGTSQPHRVGT